MEEQMNEMIEVLQENCIAIPHDVIEQIVLVPEFLDALEQSKIQIDDQAVYRILRRAFFKIPNYEESLFAKDVMSKVSKYTRGKSNAWIDNSIGNNHEVGFLYEKCKKIKPGVISSMRFVPEYMKAIKNYKGFINDEVVYSIIKDIYTEMLKQGKSYRDARDIMNKVSRDVKGNSSYWKEGI